MPQELEAAKTLAIRAGAILLEHYRRPNVRWKGQGNPVTDADRAASAFLTKELHGLFPADGILSEEEADDLEGLSRPRVWIVDPLDGTMEFINRIDEFAVMIGLAIGGIPSLGIVYQPTTQKLYYGESGSGAFVVENRQTRLLQVSSEANPGAATIALSRSHPSSNIDLIRQRLGVVNSVTWGSIGLKVGLIYEGLAHLYLHTSPHTSLWDTCAADVILYEAGGRMTDLENARLRYNGPDVRNRRGVVASNGALHERVIETAHAVLSVRID